MVVARHAQPTAPARCAGFGSRLVAYLLDWLVTFILGCLFLAAGGLLLLASSDSGRENAPDSAVYAAVIIASLVAPVWLAITLGGWAWYGRSVGKVAMNLRIVDGQGRRPGLLRALLRLIVFVIEGLPPALLVPTAVVVWMLRRHVPVTPAAAVLGGSLLAPLASALLVMRDRSHRALHDLVAGTRVIVDAAVTPADED